jgi:hypothetical protein
VLVFVATKHAAEIVADKLRKVRIYSSPSSTARRIGVPCVSLPPK